MADRYWVGGTGTWDGTNILNWSATSGGLPGASAPVATDLVFFDSSSGSGTVSVAATATAQDTTINTATLTVQLTGNVSTTGIATLNAGTFDLNGFTFQAAIFQSSFATARTLAFGTGKIILTGNNATIWTTSTITNLTVTGTPVVDCTYSGSTGTRTLLLGALAEASTISFNITAGTDTVSVQNRYRNLNFTGFAGTLANNARSIYGSLTLSAAMTTTDGAQLTSFLSTSGPNTITSNGNTMGFPVTFNGSGGSWVLADAMTMTTGRAFTLQAGTFDANGNNVTIGSFALNAGTKTLTLGSGRWTCLGSWNANTNVSGLTVTASAGVIDMTSASSKNFQGGAKAWPTLNQGGAGALNILQANMFADISNSVNGTTINLPASTTTTVSAFSLAGASGNLTTLQSSSAGTQAVLSKASGTVSVSYLSIKDIAATGGATWNAFTSNGNVDAGDNTGWRFDASTSNGLSLGTGLYANATGLWGGNSGLWGGARGLTT